MNNKMKAAMYPKLNDALMRYHHNQDIHSHPNCHLGLTPNLIQMRAEIYGLGLLYFKKRKEKLADLFICEYLQEEKELREVEYAYINTQP